MKTNVIDGAAAMSAAEDSDARIAHEIRLRQKQREKRAKLLKHAFLIVLSFVMLYPLFWLTASSLKPENEIFGSLGLWPFSQGRWAGASKGPSWL